jgi:hydrogenase maturation protease
VNGPARVLVAGVGNVFFGDDGFGPEVARALLSDPPPATKIEDFGIRGLHLAYELLAGYERAILIDAAPRGDVPGTLYVIDAGNEEASGTPDAHRMDVQNVFAYVRLLGGDPPPVTIVGCEPQALEMEIGLSEAVTRSIASAATLVRRLVAEQLASALCESTGGIA